MALNANYNITISMLNRAKKVGFSALVVTLDIYILGWQTLDMNNGYNPFSGSDKIGVAVGFTDPVFQEQFKKNYGVEVEHDEGAAAAEWTKTIFPGFSHGWEDVKFLQEHWDGPIIRKAIQTVADAKKVVDVGAQATVVSNHSGHQSDGGVSSLGVLPRIVDAVGGDLDVIFDSGVCCGVDIAKALALGAKMVLIGRPYIDGVVLGGKAGVIHVIMSLPGRPRIDITSGRHLICSARCIQSG